MDIENQNHSVSKGVCTSPHCERKLYAHAHYLRMLNGQETDSPIRVKPNYDGAHCRFGDCTKPAKGRGLCHTHYEHWRRYGNLTYRPQSDSYWAVHNRLREADHPTVHRCIECNRRAQEWSYNGGDPNERSGPTGQPYSLDAEYYVPRCRTCHRRHDAPYGKRNGRYKFSDEIIDEIRGALARGELQRVIGSRVGVSQSYVSSIKLGKIRTRRNDSDTATTREEEE